MRLKNSTDVNLIIHGCRLLATNTREIVQEDDIHHAPIATRKFGSPAAHDARHTLISVIRDHLVPTYQSLWTKIPRAP